MSTVNVDWNAIRPLNGSRASGFEELSAQLARAETLPPGCRFERKGAPDGGVECYAVFGDGSEWGWQAKYFDSLGNSQWSQLDHSVRTALEKHPTLIRYYVCVPLDRPDARISGRQSAKERWDEHVQKWVGWASAREMTVEFVYWGSHELLDRLVRPEHIGRLRFWFDVRMFDEGWFSARLSEALKAAGPRYTPEIHVDLPIAAELEAFGRTEGFFQRIKARAREIRRKLDALSYADSQSATPTLEGDASALLSKVRALLRALGEVAVQPIGVLPFQQISDEVAGAEVAANDVKGLMLQREREATSPTKEAGDVTSHERNTRFRDLYYLNDLSSELQMTHEALVDAEATANRALLILKGAAGTGKTHLLCDVARQRLAARRPTVLLMGQRFVSTDAPWTQALQQLDLASLSAEEFVGALEAAAQAANCRALVMIDAINEGSGRLIWPNHMAAFLAHLERSPWIGVVLSVRSSYLEIVIPEEVRKSAVHLTHGGFAAHEYDATRTFFIHYGLELPSTPLLAPEFSNPLFLKTLCHGLHAKDERRLPRGLHGITAIFDLYVSALNDRLASALGFHPKDNLVSQALVVFAKALVDSGQPWLTLAEAREAVDAVLPGREFERSLHQGLVLEGMLLEEAVWRGEESPEEVVFIAYDRLGDHLVAKALLDTHFDLDAPASVFEEGAPLAFLCDGNQYVSPGLLEAMCIQIPERTGDELISLAPKIADRWGLGDAFRQSLVWRDLSSFTEGTREALNELTRSESDWDDTLDVLLTVATLPGHPLNAIFLDQRLSRDSMPERDAWWSIYLHHAWGNHGAVDRLVDWASSVAHSAALDDDTVDLSATTLSWMLATPNRFLRDRATKALVNLLTGRLGAVRRLLERFVGVDDPYVAERIYAVTYGTAMRSHDGAEVGALAIWVYDRVFAGNRPPAHILLRDYARGVVERAVYLEADLQVDHRLIQPPYNSEWPNIPTKDEIKPLLPDWSRGSHDSGDIEWARNRIGSSVMDDDFARYVIGTNSAFTNWLSLRLEEPRWQSVDERLVALTETFSETEKAAWERFKATDDLVSQLLRNKWFGALRGSDRGADRVDGETGELNDLGEGGPDITRAERERDEAFASLDSVLSEMNSRGLKVLLTEKNSDYDDRRPPRLDLELIQRYVLWRVFDLGWTTDQFGQFDRYTIRYRGREASKAERIGKKYQWIAYHEIMALVADHFQYREEPRGDGGDKFYCGPWQDYLRDIDPSNTLRSCSGTSWEGHSPAWWGAAEYESWGDSNGPREWVMRHDDLPSVDTLLSALHPEDASRWLNVQGFFLWRQRPPADRESTEVELRELWYSSTGYLIAAQDADAFMEWAEGADFWGRWMPDPPEVHRMFLGEHGWSPASRYFRQSYFGDEDWVQPRLGCPVKLRTVAFDYVSEAKGFDCSVDDSCTLRLPTSELVTGLGLRWSGRGAEYLHGGQLAAFDPTAHAEGPSALLLREELLKGYLASEKLTICWVVLGEKRVLGPGVSPERHPSLRMSGAYVLGDSTPSGFLTCMLVDPETGDRGSPTSPLARIQSSQ